MAGSRGAYRGGETSVHSLRVARVFDVSLSPDDG